ncbi:MAG: hypothetical protein ACREEM_33350, partial [Blastocatellia bacterium]
IKAFDRFPIVALGEVHWSQTEHEFVHSLIRHPAFANKVNDIVVEFGNGFYQPIMDRYIAGETVARTELRQVWRNTAAGSMATPMTVWDVPIYERFFAVVRDVNQTLPKQKRLRVLLGDPPIDWNAIKSRADMKPVMFDRDGYFVNVIEKEVLGKGRRALLFHGTGHLIRKRPAPPPTIEKVPGGVTVDVEKRHPGAVFVVTPHQGFGERNEELEQRLATWPKPGLALVKNTWLGDLRADVYYPMAKKTRLLLPDGGSTSGLSLWEGLKYQDLTDAYLYLGPKDSVIIDGTLPLEVQQDEEYQRELERRRQLLGRRP